MRDLSLLNQNLFTMYQALSTPSTAPHDPDLIFYKGEEGYYDDGDNEVISDDDLSVLSRTEADIDGVMGDSYGPGVGEGDR